jgi:hypothetical protein
MLSQELRELGIIVGDVVLIGQQGRVAGDHSGESRAEAE